MSSKVGLFSPDIIVFTISLLSTLSTIIDAVNNRDNSSDCILLGFAGSTLNQCGYCVGGETGLPSDYGVDCAGTCGLSFTDCAGKCNGESFQDECTHECINGLPWHSNTFTSNENETFQPQIRDCRRICNLQTAETNKSINTFVEIGYQYVTDDCGICVVQSLKIEGHGSKSTESPAGTSENTTEDSTKYSIRTTSQRPTIGLTTKTTTTTTTATTTTTTTTPKPQTITLPNNETYWNNTTMTNSTIEIPEIDLFNTTMTNGTIEIPETGLFNGTFNISSNALHADEERRIININGSSAYADCTGTCYTPATVHSMAVMSEETCNQCIAVNSSKLNLIRNQCGRCIPDPEPCLCPKAQQDACGVCNGHNDTCITILSAYPTIVPSETPTTVETRGVTLKSKYHSVCLLIRRDILADGRDEWKFPAEVSDTNITCSITAPEGIYKLHLAITLENGDILKYSNTSLPFIVYSKSAAIRSMSPSTAIIPKQHYRDNRLLVVFKAMELQRIHTLFCTIYGNGYDEPVVVTSTSVTENQVLCSLPYPVHSSMAHVNVSLDLGVTGSLAGPFQIIFYASAPSVTHFVPLPEGDRLVIFFDHDVLIINMKSINCTSIFAAASMVTLGDQATCVWVTKRQLMVTLGPTRPSSTPANDSGALLPDRENVILFFKEKSISSDNETYTVSASNMSIAFQLADEFPLAILVGPSGVIPPCGDFVLDGHQSAGLQSRRARFKWSVKIVGDNLQNNNSNPSSSDLNSTHPSTNQTNTSSNTVNRKAIRTISESLLNLMNEATTMNKASVIIQSSDLDFGVEYVFSLTVTNGASVGSPSSTDELTIGRSRMPLPALLIEPSVAHYKDRVSVDSRFTLTAHMDKPTCLRELYSIHFRWSTNNPRVKFDVTQMNSTVYTVKPYTLPSNENVTFQVEVWLNNDPNISSKASIHFMVDKPIIRVILVGGKEMSVGVASGVLNLNASGSYHTSMPNLPLVYRWECLTEDENPCYNYDPSISETLLLAKPIERTGVLSIPTERLRSGDRMKFTVRAFSPKNPILMSNANTVIVHVKNDNVPMVTIEKIAAQNQLEWSKPEVYDEMLYQVPSDVNVKVVAIIQSSNPITTIKWEIPGFAWDLNKYSLQEEVIRDGSNWTTKSSLIIRKDFLVANGLYELNITATDDRGEIGWSMAEFIVTSPVTNCRVTIDEYEAFTMTYLYLDGCTASHNSYPLSYQAFVYYKDSPMSISPIEYHLPMAVMGPPVLPPTNSINGELNNDSMNTFAVKVCDVSGNCWLFNSSRTKVRPARDMQEAAEHAFAMANIAKLTDNYLTCLRRHAFYLMEASSNPSYLAENDLEFQSQLAQAYVCARKAAEVQCTEATCFANLFTFLTAIPIDTRTSREYMMTEVLDRALHRIESKNMTLNAVGVQEAFIVLESVYRFNVSDIDEAEKVAEMENKFQTILARSLAIGESPVLVDTLGHPVVAMSYNGLNSSFDVLTNSTANSTVTVLFGTEFKSKYDAWICQENGSMCRGVVAEMQFYPEHVYRPIEIDERPNRTVSEVIKVTLLNPATGEIVEDQLGGLTMTVPVDRSHMSEDLEYECHFWNDDDQEWSRDGMKTLDGGGKTLDCDSQRLATFVVIGSEPTMSPWVIAAIILSCALVIVIGAGVGFFLYRKSRTKTMRVSMSRG